MVRAIIYLEGGASGPKSKILDIRCERAFHRLLDRMGFSGRKPRLVACGGRDDVYRSFYRALRSSVNRYVAMWIDSEEPMDDIEKAWKHLAEVTTVGAWEKPDDAADNQVLFMTTCMETWIVADRAALREHYKQNLNENPLPHPSGFESQQRHDVQHSLETATKYCKNAYAKGKRSFDIFEKLDPAVLLQHLPSFGRIARILDAKL